MVPEVSRQKRRTDGASIHSVAISFRPGGFTSMKVKRNLTHFQHANGCGQNIVQSFRQILGWNGRFDRNVATWPRA